MISGYKQLKAYKKAEIDYFNDQFNQLQENFYNEKTGFIMSMKKREELPMGRPNAYKIDENKYVGIVPSTNKNVEIKELEDIKFQFELLNICVEEVCKGCEKIIADNNNTIDFASFYIEKVKNNKTEEYKYAINRFIKDKEELLDRWRSSQYCINEAFDICGFKNNYKRVVVDYQYDL